MREEGTLCQASLSVNLPSRHKLRVERLPVLPRERSGNAGRDSCLVTFHAATLVDLLTTYALRQNASNL